MSHSFYLNSVFIQQEEVNPTWESSIRKKHSRIQMLCWRAKNVFASWKHSLMNVVWGIIILYNFLNPHGNSKEELVVLICSFASTQKIDWVSHIFSPPWICCGSQAMCLGCRRSALTFTFLHFSLPSCHQLITRITFGEHFWNSQNSGIFPPLSGHFGWITGRRIAQSAGGSPLPNQGRTLKAETTGSQGRCFW